MCNVWRFERPRWPSLADTQSVDAHLPDCLALLPLLPKVVEEAYDLAAIVLAPASDGVITVWPAHMDRMPLARTALLSPYIGRQLE